MASSNIDRLWNDVEQMNDGGNSTHKTMRQRRKFYARKKKNVDKAQQREPLLQLGFKMLVFLLTSLILEMASAVFDQLGYPLVGMVLAFVALLLSTTDLHMVRKERMLLEEFEQDELKKLKGSKSRDMVDDFKSGRTGAFSASAREQNNVDKAQQREPLLTGEFELPPDTPDDQEPLFLALDSVHHVDRIVPPTIDENYNRREATERLVQPGVGASSFVDYGNHNAISTSQQENVAGDEGTTPAAATRDHTPGRYFEEFRRWLMSSDDGDKEPGEYEELLAILFTELKSGWALLLTSLILEIASAVFDQLGYEFVGMVLAFVALLVATADLIHMAGKERMSLLPIFRRTATGTFEPAKPANTIVEYFGLVGAVWQFVYSTVAYAYARQKRENPIKMSLLPLIFLSYVVISKLREKISLTRVLRKELEKISEREKDRMKRESGTGAGKEGLHNEKPKDFDNWKNVDKEVKDKKRQREADIGGRPEKGSTMSGKESDDGCADGEIATERERGVQEDASA